MRWIAILALFALIFGCTGQEETTYSTHKDGQMSFDYPDWPDADKERSNFLVKNNGKCVFAAAKYPIPSMMLEEDLEKHFQESFKGEYIDYTIFTGESYYDARTRVMYCDYSTYSFTLACLDSIDDPSVLETAKCDERDLDTKPKLGLIPLPPNDDFTQLDETFKDARSNGVDVLYFYFKWKDLATNWTTANWVMEPMSYEGRTAVVFNVIHTNVLGEYPSKYSSFDDPGFKEDFSDFSVEFVERYKPDYYFVGNEVDDYLWNHRDMIPAFQEILRETREKVKKANPSTKVGFTTTYHDALTHNATDIIVTLSEDADIIGYTTYGYHDMFVFDDVSQGVAYLEELVTAVPGKPCAVVETGWSSSTILGSSEEKQKEFAEAFFDYLETTDAEFVNWYAYHDGVDCTEGAESFLVDMPEVKEDEEFMASFKEFLCSLGIKKSDGTPKKAWSVWQENT